MQRLGRAHGRLAREDEPRAVAVLRLRQLRARHALRAHLRDLAGEQLVERVEGDALVGDREEEEDAGAAARAERVEHRLRGGGGLRVARQHAIQARALPLAEDRLQQLERRHVGVVVGGDAVDVHDGRQVGVAVEHVLALLAGVERLLALHRRRRLAAPDAAEVLLDEPLRLGRLEVAGDDERGVVRRVVEVEELLHVRRLPGVQVVHRADDRVRVGEAARRVEGAVRLLEDDLHVRRVVDAQPALLLHGLALVVEVRVGDGERAHAVGLEPEREVEPVRRHRLVVVGAVLGGAPVEAPAGPLEQRHVVALPHVLRALEHHVLEEVREAAASFDLTARADVIPDVDRHERCGVVLVDDYREPVAELERLGGNAELLGRSRCRK